MGAELKLATANSWWTCSLQLEQEAFDHAFKQELAVSLDAVSLDRSALLRLWAAAYIQEAGAIRAWQGQSVSLRVDCGPQSWAQAGLNMVTTLRDTESAAAVLRFFAGGPAMRDPLREQWEATAQW